LSDTVIFEASLIDLFLTRETEIRSQSKKLAVPPDVLADPEYTLQEGQKLNVRESPPDGERTWFSILVKAGEITR
jgi:hypothetical protein